MVIFPIEFNDFSKFGDRFLEAKSIKNQLKNEIQDSIPKFNPLWPENQTQDTFNTLPRRPHEPRRSKTSPRRLQEASKTTPRRFPDASRYSQDALKTALNLPRHPKMLPRRPKTPQDASKTPPRCLQTSILGDL